jgi:hypothetical protein
MGPKWDEIPPVTYIIIDYIYIYKKGHKPAITGLRARTITLPSWGNQCQSTMMNLQTEYKQYSNAKKNIIK